MRHIPHLAGAAARASRFGLCSAASARVYVRTHAFHDQAPPLAFRPNFILLDQGADSLNAEGTVILASLNIESFIIASYIIGSHKRSRLREPQSLAAAMIGGRRWLTAAVDHTGSSGGHDSAEGSRSRLETADH